MAKINHNAAGHNRYETGDDHGILFVMADANSTDKPDAVPAAALPTGAGGTPIEVAVSLYEKGVAWEGLTAVTVSPSGADETELWADNKKYGSFRAAEKFGATIESYTYPEKFELCDGAAIVAGVRVGQQSRKKFGFFFRSKVGNDLNPDAGYKYHWIYNSTASPSEKSYATVNDSPDAITFSHEISADAVTIPSWSSLGLSADSTCEISIDSSTLDAGLKANLDKVLAITYGATKGVDGSTVDIDPQLLSPEDILKIMSASAG